MEFLITMVLVLVVFGSAADENNTPNVKVAGVSSRGCSCPFQFWPQMAFYLFYLADFSFRVLLLLPLDSPSPPATSLPSLSLGPGLNIEAGMALILQFSSTRIYSERLSRLELYLDYSLVSFINLTCFLKVLPEATWLERPTSPFIELTMFESSSFYPPFRSMNPARTFGSNAVMSVWKDHWVSLMKIYKKTTSEMPVAPL